MSSLADKLAEHSIRPKALTPGSHTMLCPRCSADRKAGNKKKPCLSLKIDDDGGATWLCHNCEWKGNVPGTSGHRPATARRPPPKAGVQPPAEPKRPKPLLDFFAKRKISPETVEEFGIYMGQRWFPQVESKSGCIVFPYRFRGEVVNNKYRNPKKHFVQDKEALRTLYNADSLVDNDVAIWVEGEMDVLAVAEAGFDNAVSLPDGAPAKHKEEIDRSDARYLAIENCAELLAPIKRHIIAVDSDEPGQALAHQLVHRLGVTHCFQVKWPSDCKDAGEVLQTHGPGLIKTLVETARGYPIRGLIEISPGQLLGYRNSPKIDTFGLGLQSFDSQLLFRPKQVVVVTGWPSSGKSEVVDWVAVMLTRRYGWRWAICSPEHETEEHAAKLAEKYKGEPFKDYGVGVRAMDDFTLGEAEAWIGQNFQFIVEPDEDAALELDWILKMARTAWLRHGIRGLVIDPYNEIAHDRGQMSETDYVSLMMRKLKNFARNHDLIVFLIAHPTKLQRSRENNKRPIPTMHDISGCYSDDTEVLTDRGWRRHSEIKKHWKVLCFDLTTNDLKWQRPTEIHRYDHDGPMHHYSGYSLDLLVTPDHRMVVKPGWARPGRTQENPKIGRPDSWPRDEWQFVRSNELTSALWKMPMHGNPIEEGGPIKFDFDDGYPATPIISLVGYYVSEGWHSMGSVAVCQALETYMPILQALQDAGLSFSEKIHPQRPDRPNEKPIWRARLYKRKHPELVNWFLDQCGRDGCATKRLPDLTWNLGLELKRVLFEALIWGDGRVRPTGGFSYSTTSEELSDQFQRLAIELGFYATVSSMPGAKPHHLRRYVIEVGLRSERYVQPTKNRTDEQYQGQVWCLTVPTGAYVTRRNGAMAVCGNSANFFNKADVGFVVHRPDFKKSEVDVIVEKVKRKDQGSQGVVGLVWDKHSGLYRPAPKVGLS